MQLIDIRRDEVRPLAWAAGGFFCVLASYYMLRPVRETYAVALSTNDRASLFVWTLIVMLIATPVYGLVTTHLPRRLLVPTIYGFFAANLVWFWWLLSQNAPPKWGSSAFFVWISVFNLFIVTLFWGVTVDVFTGEQGKRLFGLVAAAGTVGQLASSRAVQFTADRLSTNHLLGISLALLLLAAVCCVQLRRSRPQGDARSTSTETFSLAGAWQGVLAVMRSRHISAMAAVIVLLGICGTAVYLQMLEAVGQQVEEQAEQTKWFARLNEWHGYLTLFGQGFVAAWLLRKLGVAVTLALVPAIYFAGFLTMSITTSLAALAMFQVAIRVAAFAIGVPALEVLWTAVPIEEKYRAKQITDAVGKRTGDVIGAKGYAALVALGWLPQAISFAMLPVTLVVVGLAFWLGRFYRKQSDARG